MSSSANTSAQKAQIVAGNRRSSPDALFYAVMLLSWTAVWRIQDLFPVLAAIKFPMLVQLIVLVLFFADRSPLRRIADIRSPIITILLALFAIMVIGLPFSLWPMKGIQFILKEFLPTFMLMIILATSMRDAPDLERFAFTVLAGAIVYAIIVFLFYPVGADGRLADLIYYDANDFALLMVCSIPFAVYFLRPGVVLWHRLFAVAALLLLIIMIIRSGSRGAFLGFIGVILYILLRYRTIPKRLRIGAAVGGTVLLAAIGSTAYWEMMKTLLDPKDDYNMTDEAGRKAVWQRGLGYMVTHPVLGVGVRTFPQAEGMLSEIAKERAAQGKGIKWSVAHNSFIEIGAECGIIALGLFIALLVIAIRTLASVQPDARGSPISVEDSAFSQMLIASFIGYIICGFFISAQYFAYLYVLLGLVLGQQAVLRRRRLAPRPIGTPIHKTRVVRREIKPHWIPAGR